MTPPSRKPNFAISIGAVVVTLLLNGSGAVAQSPADRVRLEVKMKCIKDRPKQAGQAGQTMAIEKRSLEIHIDGQAKVPETRRVKWILFSRHEVTHGLRGVGKGVVSVALPPFGGQKLTTSEESIVSYPAFMRLSGGRREKVAATGEKYVGYRVTVVDGDQIVAEATEPARMKEEFLSVSGAAFPGQQRFPVNPPAGQ